MIQANISTIKSHLSRYIDRVKAGEEVVISDRTQAVAVLGPYVACCDDDWSSRVSELRRRGQVVVGRKKKGSSKRSSLTVGRNNAANLSDAVIEERRSGR